MPPPVGFPRPFALAVAALVLAATALAGALPAAAAGHSHRDLPDAASAAGAAADGSGGAGSGSGAAGSGGSGSSAGSGSGSGSGGAASSGSAGAGATVAPPSDLPADCSTDVSQPMQHWLRTLPPDTTVQVPPGACYLVDEGLQLRHLQGLTIDGGTWRDNADLGGPQVTEPDVAVFWLVGGTDVTLEDLTIDGTNPGGYHVTGAFAAGIRSDGVVGLTVTSVTIDHTWGDGIWLNVLRAVDDNGPDIVNPTEDATISDVDIDGAGRQGFAFVGVTRAMVTDVDVTNIGFDTFDFEADQYDEGARDVTIDGCTSGPSMGPFFANIGNGDGSPWTKDILVENCTMPVVQAGDVMQIAGPAGQPPRGPITFSDDHFRCGNTSMATCLEITNADVTVTGSTIAMPSWGWHEQVYTVGGDSTVQLSGDQLVQYSGMGAVGRGSAVDLTGDVLEPYVRPGGTGSGAGTPGRVGKGTRVITHHGHTDRAGSAGGSGRAGGAGGPADATPAAGRRRALGAAKRSVQRAVSRMRSMIRS